MCGIVGLAKLGVTDISEKDREVFLQLLHTGVVRGYHGTGIFAVQENGKARLVKSAGPPYMLMVSKEFMEFWKACDKNARVLVGHNRLATTGQKITKHAHPFLKSHIVMVHNGSLDQNLDLPKFKEFEVDSEGLAHSIATLGIAETLSRTSGAYALVFWNTTDGTLNFIRNSERPLHLAIDRCMNRVLFASEPGMLDWIMKRNYYAHQDIKIIELPTDQLWTFKLDSIDHTETTMTGKARIMGIYQGYTGDWWKDSTWDQVAGRW